MGLFDTVVGSKEETLSQPEAFAGVALCAIAADGLVTPEEAAGLGTTLARMKLFAGMSSRELNVVFEKLIKVLRGDGVEALLTKSAAAIDPEMRATAFVVAADLLLADGHMDAKEKGYLETIQQRLGVDDATALKAVEIIAIKNRG